RCRVPLHRSAFPTRRSSDLFNALPPDFRELGPSYRAANPGGTERWLELERTSRAAGSPPPAQTMRNRISFASLEGIKVPTLLLTDRKSTRLNSSHQIISYAV